MPWGFLDNGKKITPSGNNGRKKKKIEHQTNEPCWGEVLDEWVNACVYVHVSKKKKKTTNDYLNKENKRIPVNNTSATLIGYVSI